MRKTKVDILNDDQLAQWDAFVANHPEGTIYHTAGWRNVVKKVYGHLPVYFTLFDHQDRIIGGIPVFLVKSRLTGRRLSTIPLAQCCSPLVKNIDQYTAIKNNILKYMKGKSIKNWELRVNEAFACETECCLACAEEYNTYLLILKENPAELYKCFSRTCIKQAIRKAEKVKIKIKHCNDKSEINEFYQLYVAMRKRKGLLPQPQKFFNTLWDELRPKNNIEILYAVLNGRIISALLLLRYKKCMTCEYGATEYQVKNTGASPFLYWSAICQACIEGFEIFDFGRTSSDNIGLISFKKRWGTKVQLLKYLDTNDISSVNILRQSNKARYAMKVMVRNCPTGICCLAGKIIYNHLV